MVRKWEHDSSTTPHAMLTVSAVARWLGVAPSTLRTWDRRYGLGPSSHIAGSHRRYSPDDVNRLAVMRGLVMEGVSPAEAAQIALGTLSHLESEPDATSAPDPKLLLPADPEPDTEPSPHLPEGAGRAVWPMSPLAARHLIPPSPPDGAARPATGPGAGTPGAPGAARQALPDPVDDLDEDLHEVLVEVIASALGRSGGRATRPGPATAGRGPDRVAPEVPGRETSGASRPLPLPDVAPRVRGLARAATSLDTHELSRLLRDAVGAYGVIGAWNTMMVPVLDGLGDRWHATGDGVDVEHAFSETVLGVLRSVTAMLHRPRNVRPVLLSCVEGDYHSLPLHALAAALAESEVGCRLLGAGLPDASLVRAVRRTGPVAVLLYAQLPVADTSVLRELPRQRPAPRVLAGGPGWDGVELPDVAVRIGSLQEAVDEVLALVDGPRPGSHLPGG